MRPLTKKVVFECDKCDSQFYKENALKTHRSKVHETFFCADCGFELIGRAVWKGHLETVHKVGKIMEECQYCKMKTKNKHIHEKGCVFKDRAAKGYNGSALFQDASFGWL